MAFKKMSQQIKEEILESLKERPLSIEQIRLKVESNWSTVNTYLEELAKENKVKEIISADKAKIFQRIYGDTYFDIPITAEERRKFRTLFSLIIKKYKEHSRTPTKTELSKAAVRVIKETGLSDIPVVWYLYGAIPLMIADPSQEYQEEYEFEHKQRIMATVEVFIKESGGKKVRDIQKKQHKEYSNKLYELTDGFIAATEKQSWQREEILNILNEFFIACPIDEEFKGVFHLTEKFVSTVRKLSYFDELKNYRTKILLAFNALWKFIATYKLYASLEKRIADKNLLWLYLGNALLTREACAAEELSDLYSVYWSKIDKREIKTAPQTEKMREIMQGWTGE